MDDEQETGLPASIEAAWGLRERPRKGPKRGLSLQRIVAAAIQIAEREGLAAVSMSRVAAELGASAMALYRYVSAKDELLALMVDAAYGEPPLLRGPDESWRVGLSRWAWGMLAELRRHPWVLRIPISGPPITPNAVAWMEQGLQSLRDTGLTEGEKLSAILLVSGYVRNDATIAADIAAATRSIGPEHEIMPTFARLMTILTDPQRFPALHAALASGVLNQDDDPDDEFIFGLERILDGIEALVRVRTGTASPDSATQPEPQAAPAVK